MSTSTTPYGGGNSTWTLGHTVSQVGRCVSGSMTRKRRDANPYVNPGGPVGTRSTVAPFVSRTTTVPLRSARVRASLAVTVCGAGAIEAGYGEIWVVARPDATGVVRSLERIAMTWLWSVMSHRASAWFSGFVVRVAENGRCALAFVTRMSPRPWVSSGVVADR